MPTASNSLNISSTGIQTFNGTAFSSASPASSTDNSWVTWSGTGANALLSRGTPLTDSSGRTTNTVQPLFVVNRTSSASNVTGDGTTYTIIFTATRMNVGSSYDTGTGIFTAPITGKYLFTFSFGLTATIANTAAYAQLVTTGRTFEFQRRNVGALFTAGGWLDFQGSVVTSMTASDTAYVTITSSGSTLSSAVTGFQLGTTFTGTLIC